MKFIFHHFWVLALIVFVVNVVILYVRFSSMYREYPERKKGYRQIILWYSIILFGGVLIFTFADLFFHVHMTDIFKAHHPIRYILGGYGILLSILCLIWIYFLKGVDFLEKHPGLVHVRLLADYREVTNRFWLKFIFTAFPLACIVLSVIRMVF